MAKSNLNQSDSIRNLIRDEFVYAEKALNALACGEFQITRHEPTETLQIAKVYRMRHGMAVAMGKGEPEKLKAMDELATRLWEVKESFCSLWILDTGDHEFIFFDIIDGEPAGILFFDRNQLAGVRYCHDCEYRFHGRPPDYACRKCGQYANPDTWKYHPS